MMARIVSYAQHDLTETEAEVAYGIMECISDTSIGNGAWTPEQIAFACDWVHNARISRDTRTMNNDKKGTTR